MDRKFKEMTMKLIIITTIIMALAIACSSPATPVADFSEEEIITEVTPLEVSGGEATPPASETPSHPVLTVRENMGAIQFTGLTFTNGITTVKIETREGRNFANLYQGASEKVGEYEIHIKKGKEKGLYPLTYNGRNGSILFKENGSVLMWFNDNYSDRETYYLVR